MAPDFLVVSKLFIVTLSFLLSQYSGREYRVSARGFDNDGKCKAFPSRFGRFARLNYGGLVLTSVIPLLLAPESAVSPPTQ